MMVRIHQARQYDGVTAVDHPIGLRQARGAASDTPDLSILGVDIPAAQDLVRRVHQDQRVNIPNQQGLGRLPHFL